MPTVVSGRERTICLIDEWNRHPKLKILMLLKTILIPNAAYVEPNGLSIEVNSNATVLFVAYR
jgi:hypothetical protein